MKTTKPVYRTGSVAERRARGVLLPTARIGRGKYRRAWVKSPEKIERGEKLLAMWQKEWEEAETDPTRYVHVAWRNKKESTEAQVVVRVRGRFYTEEDIEKSIKAKMEKWTGRIPNASDATGPSPGLVLIKINKKPVKGIKHCYNPGKRTLGRGRYGLGRGVGVLA